MITAVSAHPVAEGAFVDTELLSHAGDRTRRLDHHLHGLIPEFRREALLRSRQLPHLSRRPILLDGLSGSLGAPHCGFAAAGRSRRGNAVPARGELAVFCRPVVTAPAVTRRD